jgi:hypothetical protein
MVAVQMADLTASELEGKLATPAVAWLAVPWSVMSGSLKVR